VTGTGALPPTAGTDRTSGADLARRALAQAKAEAKRRGDKPGTRPTTRTPRRTRPRGVARQPVSLADTLKQLAADHGWQPGTDGGTLLDQWPTLVPDLAPHVRAVHYDLEQQRLDLRPASPAYATHLRLLSHQLPQRINTALGRPAVRTIRVLTPGHQDGTPGPGMFTAVNTAPRPGHPPTTTDPGPGMFTAVNTTPRPGGASPAPQMLAWRAQHTATRAHREATPTHGTHPWFADAYGWLREPEDRFPPTQDTDPAADRATRHRSEDTHRRALIAARTNRTPTTPRPQQQEHHP